MLLLKIGGSVITDKSKYRKIKRRNLQSLCSEIAGRDDIIIVHGAGSFGHVLALKYGLEQPGPVQGKEMEISRVTSDVSYLNNVFVRTMLNNGIHSVGIPPHSIYSGAEINTEIVEEYFKSKIIPVLYGDVVVWGNHFRIISGDEIMVHLAKKFKPESTVFVTDVDGLYDYDPKVRKDAKLIREIRVKDLPNMGEGNDATGSMPGKVRRIIEMANYTHQIVIMNGNYPERLKSYLEGNVITGTVIY
ncbi:MAG: isopentenyl phosphate kinase [Thermoplasmatales archaeon]